MIEEIFLLEILEFFLKFWLISLFLRWIVSFLPGKISDMIRFIGNIFRFPIKRFFYWLYGVSVLETDLEKSTFITEEVEDFDCRITSNITGPLLIMTYIGAFLLYWAEYFFAENLLWIGVVLYVVALAVILMSAPDFKESQEIIHVRVTSIFKWLAKAVFLSLPAYLLVHYFVGVEALAQAVFILTLLIPIYHRKLIAKEEKMIKSKKARILEADPFGE